MKGDRQEVLYQEAAGGEHEQAEVDQELGRVADVRDLGDLVQSRKLITRLVRSVMWGRSM